MRTMGLSLINSRNHLEAMMSEEREVCILIKNGKHGHDYELYDEDSARSLSLADKQDEWHEYLRHHLGVEPSEDDYVEWYGDYPPISLMVNKI